MGDSEAHAPKKWEVALGAGRRAPHGASATLACAPP
jgi:hypothetical protein